MRCEELEAIVFSGREISAEEREEMERTLKRARPAARCWIMRMRFPSSSTSMKT